MPSLNGGKKRKSTRGRKSPGRKVSRKSPGRKVSRKSGRKSRGVRGGGMNTPDIVKSVGYGAGVGTLGYSAGEMLGNKYTSAKPYAPYIGGVVGAVAGAGQQYYRNR